MTSTSTRSDFVRDNRILDRAVLPLIPMFFLIGARTPLPADRSAMWMVGMEHFGSAMDQPPLDWIAQIATGNRGRSIAECIGAIGHRFVFKPEILVLQMHLIDAERLAAIVDRPATRTIGIRQRIALRQEVALCSEGGTLHHRFRDRTARTRGSPGLSRYRYSLPSRSWFRRRTYTPEGIEILEPFGSTMNAPKRPNTVSSRS